MSRARLLAAGVGAMVAGSACGDSSAGPSVTTSYQTVQEILTEACGSCHGTASGRFFLVTMDSAQLHESGLVDPADPPQSLLNLKPSNAIPHGGGVVATYTAARQAVVNEWIGRLPAVAPKVVEAIRVGAGTSIPAPTIDGFYDLAWAQAVPVSLRVGGGWGQAEVVTLKAAYDGTYLYLLVVWNDDKASVRRQPWVKQPDGTWKVVDAKLPLPEVGVTWVEYMGASFNEENPARFNYEDKLAIMWNTYGASTVAGFEESGCAVTCHDPAQGHNPGMTYNYAEPWKAAKKYTRTPGEIADLWHWKLVRNNQHGKMDDQYVRYWSPGPAGASEGGRASDAGGAGYGSNPALNGRPQYRGSSMAVPPYYIMDAQKVALTDAEAAALAVSAELPNMITSGPTGTRADVDAKGLWNSGSWVLEIRRRRVTGDATDVQFDDLTRRYAFGVAVFDNAQIEHRYSSMVARLVFKP